MIRPGFILGATLASVLLGCSHPLEIVGEGDILSATGDRNCYLEDFQAGADSCRVNLVVHAYQETYYAVAREDDGWEFSHWKNCFTGTDAANNECSFNISAEAVKKNWGTTVAPLVAIFTQKDEPPPPPVAVYSYSLDVMGNLVAPLPLEDARLERRTAYFGFTNTTNSQRVSFWCCKVPQGTEAHMPRVSDTEAPFVLRVDLGALPDDYGLARELYADIFAPDGSYKGYSSLWYLAAQPTETIVFDDGQEHFIDYTLTQALLVDGEGTTMSLYPGADITLATFNNRATGNIFGGTVGPIDNHRWSTLNVYDGDIGRIDNYVYSVLNVSGGRITSVYSLVGVTVNISGGEINHVFSENSETNISGGTFFEDIISIEGTRQEITGGLFLGRIADHYDGTSSISIKGGDFKSGFYYNQGYASHVTFTFYGDLSMTQPVLIEGNRYESYVTGTLQEGNVISQKITCYDNRSFFPGDVGPPCNGVAIVETAFAKQ